MTNQLYLQRYLVAQAGVYQRALEEIKSCRKQSHWMWYIFPQIKGLGQSHTSTFYAIQNLNQAADYLEHPLLGKRLVEISKALLDQQSSDASEIFGKPDDLKLKSSMTLFAAVPGSHPVFEQVLEKFFNGERDKKTLTKL